LFKPPFIDIDQKKNIWHWQHDTQQHHLKDARVKNYIREQNMKHTILFIAIMMTFTLAACGKPTAPDSPDVESYGSTIKPDHNVPAEHQ